MPLPCSPASMSTDDDTSTSRLQSAASSDSEDSMITPRPGPANPEARTHANLSRPVQPSAEAFKKPSTFRDWSTDNNRERPEFSSGEEEPGKVIQLWAEKQSTSRPESSTTEQPNEAAEPTSGKVDKPDNVGTEGYSVKPLPFLSASPSISPTDTRSTPQSGPDNKGKERLLAPQGVAFLADNSPKAQSPAQPERQRSVSFLPGSYPHEGTSPTQPGSYSAYLMVRRAGSCTVSPHGGVYGSEETESSADENTAILRRRGATKIGVGTQYGATTTSEPSEDRPASVSGGYEGAAEEEEPALSVSDRDPSCAGSVMRRRKSSISKVGGASKTQGRRDLGRQGSEAPRAGEETESEGWWKGLLEKYGSVELENKGSVARDHLALERTFLAWLRTSLSFASIGVAVTQLFRLNTTLQNGEGTASAKPDVEKLRQIGKPLGATFLAISILILFLGFHRYFESQHYVIRGKFPASRGSILIVSTVAGALIVASLVVIVVVAPGAFER